MPSIDEAASAVGGNAEQARELSAGITGSKEAIAELAGALAALGVETRASEANGCADDAEALASQANALAEALDRLRARVDGLRGLLTALSSGSAPPTTSGGGPTTSEVNVPRDRPVPGFDPQRLNPTVERIMRRIGWPKRADGKTSARGLLFSPDGRSWTETPLRASRSGPASQRTDLKEPWASDPGITTRHHIEGNAAALMVKHGQRDAVLYLNIPPCGGPSRPDPKRCHPNIPSVLPKGYTLTVHTVRDGGGHSRTVYRGTGEAIK
jgi:hypothetical protein